jgi:hypothetical protein
MRSTAWPHCCPLMGTAMYRTDHTPPFVGFRIGGHFGPPSRCIARTGALTVSPEHTHVQVHMRDLCMLSFICFRRLQAAHSEVQTSNASCENISHASRTPRNSPIMVDRLTLSSGVRWAACHVCCLGISTMSSLHGLTEDSVIRKFFVRVRTASATARSAKSTVAHACKKTVATN